MEAKIRPRGTRVLRPVAHVLPSSTAVPLPIQAVTSPCARLHPDSGSALPVNPRDSTAPIPRLRVAKGEALPEGGASPAVVAKSRPVPFIPFPGPHPEVSGQSGSSLPLGTQTVLRLNPALLQPCPTLFLSLDGLDTPSFDVVERSERVPWINPPRAWDMVYSSGGRQGERPAPNRRVVKAQTPGPKRERTPIAEPRGRGKPAP